MKRIEFLAELLNGSNIVLDIGCDHGLVLKTAFDKGYIKKGLASDIGAGPLSQAKKNLDGYNVDFYLSDGFTNIEDDSYDTVVIAGMGALLITQILDKARKDAKYIIQANEKSHIIREYLMDNGFTITDEFVVKDGFYYVMIICQKGTMKLPEEDIFLGPILKTKTDSKEYYQHKINTINAFIDNTDEKSKKRHKKLLEFYKKYA